MSKVAIVYWSGTGNTEAMANAIADGVTAAGATPSIFTPDQFTAAQIDEFDAFAFGCPAMGAEQLEDVEFEPMFDDVIGALGAKKVGLFGSYGWGTGEWMEIWEADAKAAGVNVVETVICNELPDDEAINNCKALASALA